MNSNTYPSSYPQSSQQSINPALLGSFQNQNQNQGGKFPSSSSSVPGYGGGLSPAQLMNGAGAGGMNGQGTMNPGQLLQQQQHNMMNGMGMGNMGMGGMGGMGMGNMGGMGGMMAMGGGGGGMGMGINPAALSAVNSGGNPTGSLLHHPNQAQHPSPGSSGMSMHMPSSLNQTTMSGLLGAMGITPEQFKVMNPLEQQATAKMAMAAQQVQNPQQARHQQSQMGGMMGHPNNQAGQFQQGQFQGGHQQQLQQQQHHQNQQQDLLQGLMGRGGGGVGAGGGYYDRPSSSASSHTQNSSSNPNANIQQQHHQQSQQHQMMPPPPPRPSTAQSQSRPGTSMSHHSPGAGLGSAGNSGMQQQRPPSRAAELGGGQPQQLGQSAGQQYGGMMANGYPGGKPQQQQPGQQAFPGMPGQQQQQSHQQAQQHQHQHQQGLNQGQNPYPQSQHSPPPMPGSPYRGAKRKVGGGGMESPRLGSGLSLSAPGSGGAGIMMGPPAMTRAEVNHMQGVQPTGQPGMGMGGSGGMGGMNPMAAQMNQMNGYAQRQSPRPQSSNGIVPPSINVPGMGAGAGMGMGTVSMGGMGMGVGMGMGGPGGQQGMGMPTGMMAGVGGSLGLGISGPDIPLRPPQPQQQPPQRQSSIPPGGIYPGIGLQQGQGPPPQQQQPQLRQPSLPPPSAGLIPPQQQMQKSMQDQMGLNIKQGDMRSSAPPPGGIPASVAPGGLGGSASPTAPTAIPVILPPAQAPSAANAITNAPSVIPQLPPLPANVSLNPVVTRVTVVPLVDSLKAIPALNEDEIKDIQGWMQVDKEYEGVFRKMKERMTDEMREVFGPTSVAWWEKGALDVNPNRWRRGREPFDVRYPRSRKEREGRERRKPGRREGLRLPRKLDLDDANRPEQLVPIRLEFDVEHHKMRDTFVWNLNDPVVTPENFAQSVVEDYNLAPSYHTVITKSIQDQLSDYKAHSANYDGDGGELGPEDTLTRGLLDEESTAWWELWRKRLESGFSRDRRHSLSKGRKRRKMAKEEDEVADILPPFSKEGDKEKPMTLDELEADDQSMHEDMRILIKLDIIVGSMKLDDQFEWDLENVNASPEDFADIYVQDLGLAGEFRTAIAHSIREQVQTYQKSLFLVGHPLDGSAVQDEELRLSFLPSLTSGARSTDQVQLFTPLLNYLSDGEIEKNEKDRDKDMNKRRKRNTRGRRGIALPDREPIRTYRTPAIGFPELDPATLALAVAANAPMSRRAAAAAASLTIANMVASENGTAFLPQSIPSAPQPPPTASKEKKPKGLFKSPAYPPSVLRPRAHVAAPTPSTAADVSTLPAPLENDPPPSTSAAPPDSKISKIITARRAKELEREAKEKEFADGQHPNYIDGVWHCSNCGCPESIAVGRRKGPLGDKSQCGTCGKYWHRHRRPRPCEYNSDPDFHSGVIKRETELAKSSGKKKSTAAALRAQSSTLPATPIDGPSEPQTPTRSIGDIDLPSRHSPLTAVPPTDDDRAMSPVSTASSASEPPLAQRVKMNGVSSHTPSAAPPPPTPAPVSTPSVAPTSKPPPTEALPSSPSRPSWPPQWLSAAMQAMQAKYPNDKFEVILRKVNATTAPEWRMKCLDCPGKLYTPGPGETLSNYEVHLKNRLHRQHVNDRLNGTNS